MMSHDHEALHANQNRAAVQVLCAFRALEQGTQPAGRHITREVDGFVEIGRDCPLEEWMLALEIGLFREEWFRQREKATLMLAKIGDGLLVPSMGLAQRRAMGYD